MPSSGDEGIFSSGWHLHAGPNGYFFLAATFFLSAACVKTEAARLRAGLDLEVLRTLLASFAILGEDFSFLAII
jgi:hypothetical protein